MLTRRIVGILYPKNPKHIRNELRCDKNRNTSDPSNKMRYGVVNPVHVGVELLNQHERIIDRLVTTRIPFLTVNDSGKVSVNKMTQNDLAF